MILPKENNYDSYDDVPMVSNMKCYYYFYVFMLILVLSASKKKAL